MEIYKIEPIVFFYALFALLTIATVVTTILVIWFFVVRIRAERKCRSTVPVSIFVTFVIVLIVPIVLTIVFGGNFVKYASYDYNMKKGDAHYLEGDVVLVSYEESYYRDVLSGYDVVLELDGKTVAPSNTFSKEIVRYFESEQKLIIQYGEIKNDGIYVYSIKIAE